MAYASRQEYNDHMREYMRVYRARKKAGLPKPPRPGRAIGPAKPRLAYSAPDGAIPLGRPLSPSERRDDAILESIEARGGHAEWTATGWREKRQRRSGP